jgi:hypothetical protein
MVLQFVSPSAVDRVTQSTVPASTLPPEPIVEENFEKMRVWMAEIHELILHGDGSGSGTLPRSKFLAEPMESDAAPAPPRSS